MLFRKYKRRFACEKQIYNGILSARGKGYNWKYITPLLVLYLNIAHRGHKYYKAIAGVTAFIPKLYCFKVFITNARKTVFKASNVFQKDDWVSGTAERCLELCVGVPAIAFRTLLNNVWDRFQILLLRNFKRVNFYSPWNHQKAIDFLLISGGIKSFLIRLDLFITRSEVWRRSLTIALLYMEFKLDK